MGRCAFVALVPAAVLLWTVLAAAEDPSPGSELGAHLQPGLLATYRAADGRAWRRVDEAVALDAYPANDTPADSGSPPGSFQVHWEGLLSISEPDAYRLHAFVQGGLRIVLQGRTVLETTEETSRWCDTLPVELQPGDYPLEIDYATSGDAARVMLCWSASGFGLEPLAGRWLLHRDSASVERASRGRSLVRVLRCDACHRVAGHPRPLMGPALDKLGGNLSPDWLRDFLAAGHPISLSDDPPPAGDSAGGQVEQPLDGQLDDPRMLPALAAEEKARTRSCYDFTQSEVTQLTAYLLGGASQVHRPEDTGDEPVLGDRSRGERLFLEVGCLACHTWDDLGGSRMVGGGELAGIGRKRPAGFFARWLADPASINADHRMPVFELEESQRLDLASFLADPGAEPPRPQPVRSEVFADSASPDSGHRSVEEDSNAGDSDAQQAAGARIARARGCAACHRLPSSGGDFADGSNPLVEAPALRSESAWDAGCVASPRPGASRPGYPLHADDVRAIREYATQARQPMVSDSALDLEHALEEWNCLACHARGRASGIAPVVERLVEDRPFMAADFATLVPPPLDSVGDKLRRAALRGAIDGSQAPLRPWLKVRMPRYALSDAEFDAVVGQFISRDRVPPRAEFTAPADLSDDELLRAAGGRLLSAGGLGCTGCHAVGGRAPHGPDASRGPDLARIAARVRRLWYDRWVRAPGRIAPRVEMPAFVLPAPGVLESDLDRQLSAIWHVLNLPDFQPPAPDAVRVVRQAGGSGRFAGRATVLTDNLVAGDWTVIKPLLVALPSRQNILFDLAKQRLCGWWLGDAAEQRTRGKYWYWRPAGREILPARDGPPEFSLLSSDRRYEPRFDSQLPPAPDWIEWLPGGVRFKTRLTMAPAEANDNAGEVLVDLVQTIRSADAVEGLDRGEVPDASWPTAFRRTLRFERLPGGARMVLRYASPGRLQLVDAGRVAISDGPPAFACRSETPSAVFRLLDGSLVEELRGNESNEPSEPGEKARTVADGESGVATIVTPAESGGVAELQLAYCATESATMVDVQAPPPEPAVRPAGRLPGFHAERLPLPVEIMPTALAWSRDGSLLVASLKGRVWRGRDTDGDGLEDRFADLGVELAAPFGLSATVLADGREAVDVVDKTALVRLLDLEGDGLTDRVETLADGWGHSTDYHGWVVGLPRDAEGNYFVAVSQREEGGGGLLRGAVLRLAPCDPTELEPRAYRLETVARGFRFPLGIARDAEGRIWVSDNQGEYTPFNELNLVEQGGHYGYVSRHDDPEDVPDRIQTAAVEIPHPWTRSVNGICRLESPSGSRAGGDPAAGFGVWEGDFVGCEYDTARLIRMSVENDQGVWQGAVYPLSQELRGEEGGFLGPVTAAVGPQGDLYIGGLRDSAWGSGGNEGELIRLRYCDEQVPAGIERVRSTGDGFIVHFTRPVDRIRAGVVEHYQISSYRRRATPAYGGPDLDRRMESIEEVAVSADGRQVRLRVAALRLDHLYELRVHNLVGAGERFHPAEAYCTLRGRGGA